LQIHTSFIDITQQNILMRKMNKTVPALIVAGIAALSPATASANPAARQRSALTEQASNKHAALVRAARQFLSTGYNYQGRNTHKFPGLDCLGLVFLSIQHVYGIPWQNWSRGNPDLKPSVLVTQLNRTSKPTLHDISKYSQNPKDLFAKLKEGDVIFFLTTGKLVRDESMAETSEGNDLYGLHVAIYVGNGKIIHASPFSEGTGEWHSGYAVVEESLISFMRNNGFSYFVSTSVKP